MMTGYSLKNKKNDEDIQENDLDFDLLNLVDLNYEQRLNMYR